MQDQWNGNGNGRQKNKRLQDAACLIYINQNRIPVVFYSYFNAFTGLTTAALTA
jgi:hypothetical protein